ncbi:hypothetical protein TSAR_008172 [Trichomalopsis sarcophagae]|uniref:Ionotropic glutamate receptor C-terminal domain-containing protein n=1 Tax=Trichomalopsis sarcophagae TaxID=543379 RepID=A0A232EKH3_9HYME|nr:hypothetical protein TSAR_008172 [Trichomalopsis sarcophagae]
MSSIKRACQSNESEFQYHEKRGIFFGFRIQRNFRNGKAQRVEESLMDYVNLFTKFPAQAPRSKCIIIVFNRNISIEFSNVLKFSWNKQFLYVTIIEIHVKITAALRPSSRIKESDVKVHEYNPFKDVYTSTPFSTEMQLFTNKLLNLHGYQLKTGFIQEIPLVMSKENSPNLVDGIYGMDSGFSKTLATAMNFSMIREREDRRTLKSIFMYPYGNNLIVKQRGYYKLQMSSHILSIAIIVTTIVVLSALIFVLPFDRKTWTSCNLVMILLGITTSRNPHKLSEKIFFLCLAFVSLTLSVQLWNDLLKVFLTRMSFREMKTLADAVEADVVPALTSEFTSLYFPEDKVLTKLVNKSKTIEAVEDTFGCVLDLLNKNEKVNACDVNYILGKLMADSYSNKDKKWIITFLEEPLTPCWTAMLLADSSPYLERFNGILRRILESGLVEYWHDRHRALHHFRSAYGDFFKKELEKYEQSEKYKISDQKKSKLSRHLIFLLIFGQFVSCVVLIVEIAWWYFRHVVITS